MLLAVGGLLVQVVGRGVWIVLVTFVARSLEQLLLGKLTDLVVSGWGTGSGRRSRGIRGRG